MNIEDGHGAQDTQRAKSWKEEVRQDDLQSKENQRTGKNPREKVRRIYFENAVGLHEVLYLKNIQTREDLLGQIFDLYPKMNQKRLGFRISPQRSGSQHRLFLVDDIPEEYDELYVYLYLAKHN
jgi:hypothetical protein